MAENTEEQRIVGRWKLGDDGRWCGECGDVCLGGGKSLKRVDKTGVDGCQPLNLADKA